MAKKVPRAKALQANTATVRSVDSIAHRFWKHVKRGAPDVCWPFTANTCKNGYGSFNFIDRATGRKRCVRAHRFAYELVHGAIIPVFTLNHRCGNKACCNPAHCYVGTHKQNTHDAKVDGRLTGPRLDGDRAQSIWRCFHIHKERQNSLAERFGVSVQTIWSIVSGRTWKLATAELRGLTHPVLANYRQALMMEAAA